MYLLARTLKNRLVSSIVYILSGAGFLELYIALYPSLSKEIQAYDQLAKAFPEALMKAFGIEELIFTSFEGYVATEHFSFIWPLLIIFMTLGFAASTLAGEIERRTLGLTLSQPISRTSIYFTKYLAGVLIILAFTLASIYSVVPLAALHGVSIQVSHFWSMTVLGFCFGLCMLSLGFAMSAIFSERSHVSMAAGGLLVGMYVLRIVAGLKDSWKDIEYASIFHYLNTSKALLRGELVGQDIAVLLGASVLLTLLGWVIFVQRDVAV